MKMKKLEEKRWKSRFTDGKPAEDKTKMKKLEDYRWEAWNCYRDSMCKYVFTWHVKSDRFSRMCPSLIKYQFDAYSAQGRLDVARAMIEGDLEWSDKLLDVVYKCQLCGGCDYVCGRIKEIQPGRVIQAMRAKLVADGKAPPPEFKELMENLRESQNPYKEPNSKRADWLKHFEESVNLDDVEIPDASKSDNLLYVGCSPLRDPDAEAMPKTVAELLIRGGFNVAIMGEEEKCCGNPSLRIGDQDEFVAFARENIKMLNERGVKKLVCVCPYCYSTFRRDYPYVGEKMNFEVVHVIEVIADLIEAGKLKPKKKKELTVTYHDPCHLGRISGDGVSGTNAFTGLYDAPRRILNAIPGVKLIEMERIKDDTLCCGAGSWMNKAYPDFAESTAVERITEAHTTSAEALVTHCPHCEEHFGKTLAKSGSSMKLYNLLELVLEAL
jgi:Fe-S oxidoreductase